jgi:hypothetical protein
MLIKGYVFSASDYNKIWCSLQKQTHVVVLCKTSTTIWCDVLFPPLDTKSDRCGSTRRYPAATTCDPDIPQEQYLSVHLMTDVLSIPSIPVY